MKLIPLSKQSNKNRGKYFAMVDDEDFEELSNIRWFVAKNKKNTYAHTKIEGRVVSMHKMLVDAPDGKFIDHKDGNGLNQGKPLLIFEDIFL